MKYLNYSFHVTNYQNYRTFALAFTKQTFFFQMVVPKVKENNISFPLEKMQDSFS